MGGLSEKRWEGGRQESGGDRETSVKRVERKEMRRGYGDIKAEKYCMVERERRSREGRRDSEHGDCMER